MELVGVHASPNALTQHPLPFPVAPTGLPVPGLDEGQQLP